MRTVSPPNGIDTGAIAIYNVCGESTGNIRPLPTEPPCGNLRLLVTLSVLEVIG